jgi:hypothetical protein
VVSVIKLTPQTLHLKTLASSVSPMSGANVRLYNILRPQFGHIGLFDMGRTCSF